jgi:hypothetical protein
MCNGEVCNGGHAFNKSTHPRTPITFWTESTNQIASGELETMEVNLSRIDLSVVWSAMSNEFVDAKRMPSTPRASPCERESICKTKSYPAYDMLASFIFYSMIRLHWLVMGLDLATW